MNNQIKKLDNVAKGQKVTAKWANDIARSINSFNYDGEGDNRKGNKASAPFTIQSADIIKGNRFANDTSTKWYFRFRLKAGKLTDRIGSALSKDYDVWLSPDTTTDQPPIWFYDSRITANEDIPEAGEVIVFDDFTHFALELDDIAENTRYDISLHYKVINGQVSVSGATENMYFPRLSICKNGDSNGTYEEDKAISVITDTEGYTPAVAAKALEIFEEPSSYTFTDTAHIATVYITRQELEEDDPKPVPSCSIISYYAGNIEYFQTQPIYPFQIFRAQPDPVDVPSPVASSHWYAVRRGTVDNTQAVYAGDEVSDVYGVYEVVAANQVDKVHHVWLLVEYTIDTETDDFANTSLSNNIESLENVEIKVVIDDATLTPAIKIPTVASPTGKQHLLIGDITYDADGIAVISQYVKSAYQLGYCAGGNIHFEPITWAII